MKLRGAGFRQAILDAGLAVDESLIIKVRARKAVANSPIWRLGGAYDASRGFATMSDRPIDVFVGNMFHALGAYRAFTRAGLRIPEDIALAGWGNYPFAPYLTPPLTTVRSPLDRIASVALEVLADLIGEGSAPPSRRKVLLRSQLIVRESTAGRISRKSEREVLDGTAEPP